MPHRTPADTLSLSLAGLGFELCLHDSSTTLSLPEAYSNFPLDATKHPIIATYDVLGADNELVEISPDTTMWSCLTWRMGFTPDQTVSIEIHSVRDDDWYAVANISSDFSQGQIRPIAGRQAIPSKHAINYPYDQALLMNRLLHANAGIIHAAGVAIGGGGYVFCGHSGVGKTTLARLWRDTGAILLNDDRMIIRMDQDPILAPTPWHGDESEINVQSVPLKGIVHLRQASENTIRQLDETEATTSLLATTVAPFYFRQGMERMMDLWGRVISCIPSYRFDFTPDERAIATFSEQVLNV